MRPQGLQRQALERVLQAGAAGTCEALAQRAGVDVAKAHKVIDNMRSAGVVVARSAPLKGGHLKQGRPRVIYQLSDRATRQAHSRELDRILSAWGGPVKPDGVEG